MVISIIGGTGNIGKGLAAKILKAGYSVVIGSRNKEKAIDVVNSIKKNYERGCLLEGESNVEATKKGDLIIFSVPNKGRKHILYEIKDFLVGKIIFDLTIPLSFNPIRHVAPKEGSNAMETKATCGEYVDVVAGMHTVSANLLNEQIDSSYDFDILIAGDNVLAKQKIIEVFNNLGIRAFDSGNLEQAEVLEKLAVILIGMNKRYKKRHIGIKLFGV